MKTIFFLLLASLYLTAGFAQNKPVMQDLDCGYKMTFTGQVTGLDSVFTQQLEIDLPPGVEIAEISFDGTNYQRGLGLQANRPQKAGEKTGSKIIIDQSSGHLAAVKQTGTMYLKDQSGRIYRVNPGQPMIGTSATGGPGPDPKMIFRNPNHKLNQPAQ